MCMHAYISVLEVPCSPMRRVLFKSLPQQCRQTSLGRVFSYQPPALPLPRLIVSLVQELWRTEVSLEWIQKYSQTTNSYRHWEPFNTVWWSEALFKSKEWGRGWLVVIVPGKVFTGHLKEPLSWPVTSSWMCDEAETKAEPVGLHLELILSDSCRPGGSMIVLWIKHKLLRVRTGSSRWGLQEVASAQWLLLWWALVRQPLGRARVIPPALRWSHRMTCRVFPLVHKCQVCKHGGRCAFKCRTNYSLNTTESCINVRCSTAF